MCGFAIKFKSICIFIYYENRKDHPKGATLNPFPEHLRMTLDMVIIIAMITLKFVSQDTEFVEFLVADQRCLFFLLPLAL